MTRGEVGRSVVISRGMTTDGYSSPLNGDVTAFQTEIYALMYGAMSLAYLKGKRIKIFVGSTAVPPAVNSFSITERVAQYWLIA